MTDQRRWLVSELRRLNEEEDRLKEEQKRLKEEAERLAERKNLIGKLEADISTSLGAMLRPISRVGEGIKLSEGEQGDEPPPAEATENAFPAENERQHSVTYIGETDEELPPRPL